MKLFGRNYWFNFVCWVHLDLLYFQQIDISTKVFWVGKWSILKVFTSLDAKGWQPKDKDPSCHFLSPHKGWGAPKKVTELHVVSQEDLQIWEIHWTVHYICEGIYRFQPFEWCWGTTSDIQKNGFEASHLQLQSWHWWWFTGARLLQWTWPSQCGCCHGSGYTTRIGFACRTGGLRVGSDWKVWKGDAKHRIWESLARLIINTTLNRLLEFFPKSVVVDVWGNWWKFWALQFEDSSQKFPACNNRCFSIRCHLWCRNCLQPTFDPTFAEYPTGEFWSKRYETIHHLWTLSNTCLGLLRGTTGEMKGWWEQTGAYYRDDWKVDWFWLYGKFKWLLWLWLCWWYWCSMISSNWSPDRFQTDVSSVFSQSVESW